MPLRPITVESASAGDLLADARALFEQYRRLCGGADLEKEGIADEIAGLPWVYQAPYGDLLVAKIDGRSAGCIALRTRARGEGEIKRMFVLPELRGLGIGRALVSTILKRAWSLGMERVCLDTLPSMVEAQSVYRSLGFRSCVPYGGKSADDTLFFEIERPTPRRTGRFDESNKSMHAIHRFQAKYALVLRNLRHQVEGVTLTMGDK